MHTDLVSILDDFRRYGKQAAVVHHRGNRRRVTTYAELARLAGRFARLLQSRGVGVGDRVVVWGENSAEWMAAFYGAMLRGALAVPLDAAGSAEFARRVVAETGPKLIVGDGLLLARLGNDGPKLSFEEWAEELPAEEATAAAGINGQTPLQILFTSGTTGEPKGVVLTHGNVLASVRPIEQGAQPYMRWERLIHPLRILHTLPLSHVFGQTMGLWVPAIFAAELHLENRLIAPRLIETIKKEKISVLAAVPRVAALLKSHLENEDAELTAKVDRTEERGTRPLGRWIRFRKIHRRFGLKFWAIVSGGGALPDTVERFWNVLGFVVVQGYGMTETSALITLNHPFHVASGTIGKPLPGREVKLGADGEVLVRGPMVSCAVWQDGKLRRREGEWLATGDLAEQREDGALRFVGRKSETIVTSAGVNIHPEDLEQAVESESGVAGCAVVPIETANGAEPCAVVALRSQAMDLAAVIAGANRRLADFQRIRRWVLWPEPDLPRTSTGKVRRKPVEAWLIELRAAATGARAAGAGNFGASGDWLLRLIAGITGEPAPGVGDELTLDEDLGLDSLGRVQLAAVLEEKLGVGSAGGLLDQVRTLGQLRALTGSEGSGVPQEVEIAVPVQTFEEQTEHYVYPRWPWWAPMRWLRTAFVEGVMRPLVWLAAGPKVARQAMGDEQEPLIVVANHVTAFDVPLIEYALAGPVRRRMAVAMAAEMLDDYRHWRNPETKGRMISGPLARLALTVLFNVFPLPRRRDYQKSFEHAGRALDRGFNVLIFPEGTRSAEGELGGFRGGVGLLARQSGACVLPVGLRGLGEIKAGRRRWLRPGSIEVHVGEPIRFAPEVSAAEITAHLREEVERLMGEGN